MIAGGLLNLPTSGWYWIGPSKEWQDSVVGIAASAHAMGLAKLNYKPGELAKITQ